VAWRPRVLQASLVLVGAGGIALAWMLVFGTKCDRLMKQEAEAFRAHEYQRAIALSTAIIEWGSDYGLMLRSRAHYQNGDLDKAIADVGERIRQLDAFPILCPDSYIWRAALFLKKHDDDKALHDLSKAIECDPSQWNAKAYYGRAAIYRRLGWLVEAERDYAVAKQLDPSWPRPYDEPDEGFVFDESKETGTATPTAVRMEPQRANEARKSLGDPFQGLQVSDRVRALVAIAQDALRRHEADAALAATNEAIALTSEKDEAVMANLCAVRARCYLDKGDDDAALAECDKAIRYGTALAAVYFNRASIIAERGKYESAIADFNRAIELEPTYARTYHYRGLVYAKLGMREAADRDFAKAKELDPDVESKARLRLK